eukprot:362982-Chlamydomonas_euryale.AAC.6
MTDGTDATAPGGAPARSSANGLSRVGCAQRMLWRGCGGTPGACPLALLARSVAAGSSPLGASSGCMLR